MKNLHPYTIKFTTILKNSFKKYKEYSLYHNNLTEFETLSYDFCKLKPEERLAVVSQLSKNENYSKQLLILIASISTYFISASEREELSKFTNPKYCNFLQTKSRDTDLSLMDGFLILIFF